MPSSQVLEVSVGLIFIYLVVSTVCSGIKELIARALNMRATTLENAVRNLLDYASLKLLAIDVGATVVERKRDLMTIKFRQNATIDPEKLARFVSSHRGSQFTPDGTLKFSLKMNQPAEVLQSLQTLLADLAGAVVLPSVLS